MKKFAIEFIDREGDEVFLLFGVVLHIIIIRSYSINDVCTIRDAHACILMHRLSGYKKRAEKKNECI